MNSIFTISIINSISNSAYGGLSSVIGIIVIVLVVLLILEVIFFEAVSQDHPGRKTPVFDLTIGPLLFILVVMAMVRFAQFMKLL